jgi:hypothetical protein
MYASEVKKRKEEKRFPADAGTASSVCGETEFKCLEHYSECDEQENNK